MGWLVGWLVGCLFVRLVGLSVVWWDFCLFVCLLYQRYTDAANKSDKRGGGSDKICAMNQDRFTLRLILKMPRMPTD